MAFISQEQKARLVAQCKPVLARWGLKATFSIHNHSTITCRISRGPIDFGASRTDLAKAQSWTGYWQVNPYHLDRSFSGAALEALKELDTALRAEWWDKSDLMTDYHNCAYYIAIHIGRWNKPYLVTEPTDEQVMRIAGFHPAYVAGMPIWAKVPAQGPREYVKPASDDMLQDSDQPSGTDPVRIVVCDAQSPEIGIDAGVTFHDVVTALRGWRDDDAAQLLRDRLARLQPTSGQEG